jgi:hypothetical protein
VQTPSPSTARESRRKLRADNALRLSRRLRAPHANRRTSCEAATVPCVPNCRIHDCAHHAVRLGQTVLHRPAWTRLQAIHSTSLDGCSFTHRIWIDLLRNRNKFSAFNILKLKTSCSIPGISSSQSHKAKPDSLYNSPGNIRAPIRRTPDTCENQVRSQQSKSIALLAPLPFRARIPKAPANSIRSSSLLAFAIRHESGRSTCDNARTPRCACGRNEIERDAYDAIKKTDTARHPFTITLPTRSRLCARLGLRAADPSLVVRYFEKCANLRYVHCTCANPTDSQSIPFMTDPLLSRLPFPD